MKEIKRAMPDNSLYPMKDSELIRRVLCQASVTILPIFILIVCLYLIIWP